MLGATTYLTRDIAPVPLLWVLPLVAYLRSFVVAFAPRPDPRPLMRAARSRCRVLVVILVHVDRDRRAAAAVAADGAAPGRAVRGRARLPRRAGRRPPARRSRLTEFYLWVPLGGALGGVFNALLAPVALHRRWSSTRSRSRWPARSIPGPVRERPTVLEFFTRSKKPTAGARLARRRCWWASAWRSRSSRCSPTTPTARRRRASIVFGLALGIVFNFARRPLRFGAAIAAILLASACPTARASR